MLHAVGCSVGPLPISRSTLCDSTGLCTIRRRGAIRTCTHVATANRSMRRIHLRAMYTMQRTPCNVHHATYTMHRSKLQHTHTMASTRCDRSAAQSCVESSVHCCRSALNRSTAYCSSDYSVVGTPTVILSQPNVYCRRFELRCGPIVASLHRCIVLLPHSARTCGALECTELRSACAQPRASAMRAAVGASRVRCCGCAPHALHTNTQTHCCVLSTIAAVLN
jgi:hypothetical protein